MEKTLADLVLVTLVVGIWSLIERKGSVGRVGVVILWYSRIEKPLRFTCAYFPYFL